MPGTRVAANIVYEAQAQYLQQGRHLDLIPMVKLEDSQKKMSGMGKQAPQPQWHPSHVHLCETSLEISHRQALSGWVSVDIQLSKTLEYSDDGLELLEPNVFNVLEKANKSAFDSFIEAGDILYIFQMTIKPIHDINHGLVDYTNHHNFPPRDKWHFVFIIPPNLVLKVPQLWKQELWRLSPYSAVVPVEMAQSHDFYFVLGFKGCCRSL